MSGLNGCNIRVPSPGATKIRRVFPCRSAEMALLLRGKTKKIERLVRCTQRGLLREVGAWIRGARGGANNAACAEPRLSAGRPEQSSWRTG